MQQVERRDVAKNGFSPLKGLLIVAALALAGGAFLLLTTNDPEPTTPKPTTNAPTTLTNTEALTVFRDLSRVAQEAVRERNTSLLPSVFAANSPLLKRAQAEIESLLADEVEDRSRIDVLDVSVTTTTDSRLEFEERLRITPCFLTEDGEDVTTSTKPVLQTSVWTAVRQRDEWRLYDARVTDRRVLQRSGVSCV